MEGITGKVVVITGASSGIGAAIARVLASQGAMVVLGARRLTLLEALVADITTSGGKAHAVVCDVTKLQDVQALVDAARSRFGRIDVIVNNAGIMPLSRFDALKVPEWDAMIDVNIKGTLYGIAAALPHFKTQGHGHVVNVSSIAGHFSAPLAGVYCATKHAVRALTDSLRQEEAPAIRTTIISPGAVESELTSTITDQVSAGLMDDLMKIAMPASVIANSVAYAISQPPSVDVAEVIIRPSAHI